jgi:hypothetical protein
MRLIVSMEQQKRAARFSRVMSPCADVWGVMVKAILAYTQAVLNAHFQHFGRQIIEIRNTWTVKFERPKH